MFSLQVVVGTAEVIEACVQLFFLFLSFFFFYCSCALGGFCVSAGTTGAPQASIHTVRLCSVMSGAVSVQPPCEVSRGLGKYNYTDWDKSISFVIIIDIY